MVFSSISAHMGNMGQELEEQARRKDEVMPTGISRRNNYSLAFREPAEIG